MADMDTLDNLVGPDPVATDHSGAGQEETGPDTTTAAQSTSTGASLEARLAELEATNQRNVERLKGQEQSSLEWKRQAEQNQQLVQTLTSKLQEIANQRTTQTTSDPIPQEFIDGLQDNLGYTPDQRGVEKMWRAVQASRQQAQQAPAQPVNDQQYMTKQDYQDMAASQQTQQQRIQALVMKHQELQDGANLQEVIKVYDEMRDDPVEQALNPEATEGPDVVSFWGRNFDLRLIDKAATKHKLNAGITDMQRSGPTLGGGQSPPGKAGNKSPVVPTSFVGKEGVFGDPTIQKALTRAGWGANTRQQVEKMLTHLNDKQKAEWESQYRP